MKPAGKKQKTDTRLPAKPAAAPKTVTCPHCRYERPAEAAHCPICGYPWSWTR